MKKYAVKEIFGPTIQGEGSRSGKVVSFLRFAGCNKWSGRKEDKADSVCSFCDTDFVGGKILTAHEIRLALKKIGCETVVVSGGEAMLQLDAELVNTLSCEFELHVETNGSISREKLKGIVLPAAIYYSMSPKQPIEQTRLDHCRDLKILFPYIHKDITIEKFSKFNHFNGFLQPIEDENYKSNLEGAIQELYKHPSWGLSLQLHKLIGVE